MLANKTTYTFHGICRRYRWHMPQTSLAFATDVADICHRLRWHMPRNVTPMAQTVPKRKKDKSPLPPTNVCDNGEYYVKERLANLFIESIMYRARPAA